MNGDGGCVEIFGKLSLWGGSAAGASFSFAEKALYFADAHAAGISVIFAGLGFVITLYYKRKADKRAEKAEREGRLVEVTGIHEH